jgi:uncharacterized protein (DUF2345 family)
MRRAAVRHGDPTTTGGFVIACSSTIHDDGKKVALSGDEATCGNCKGAYKIFGTGQEISEKGRAVVLDGDSVLCPCGKNRVIVGSNPGIFVEAGGGSSVARKAPTDPALASCCGSASKFDEQVRATVSGIALEGYPYFIETPDGRTFSGQTDRNGRLPRIVTNGAHEFTVHWGDAALAKQDGD